MDARIEQLEIKVAFLEEANTQLGDEVYRQRQQLEEMRARLEALAGRFEAAQAAPTAYTAEQEKPPHY